MGSGLEVPYLLEEYAPLYGSPVSISMTDFGCICSLIYSRLNPLSIDIVNNQDIGCADTSF